ncbi:glycerate kinase [Bacillus salacetis]|uniref:Glycerate kinase n=1 Tax=Bacillus salacetis TaxID=2315464 RepID=A0A3A1R0H9_9BACI|nr:glycerate kinase [Bacillus salacetis]RIW34268.1 glycerate kinase [Bacillus salacetis]
MKILVASDSYKGSLSAYEVGEAARKGILEALPAAEVFNSPMADGGEGTIDALLACINGEEKEVAVHDPLMREITAKYAVLDDEKRTVYIESARSSGLPMLAPGERDPMRANTFGLGEQIKDAVLGGHRHIVISLGGSATNDGGVGMLQALGWTFFDQDGEAVGYEGNPLLRTASFSDDGKLPQLQDCSFSIASDVTNPFYGENGAAHIFAGQKGASPEEIVKLDGGLKRLATLFEDAYGIDVQKVQGAGAAGGIGGGLLAAMGCKMQSGVDTIMGLTSLEEKIKEADIVLTGEGSLDRQSLMGKVPVGVARLARKHGKKVIGIAGRIDSGLRELNEHLDAVFSIQTECRSLEEALQPEVTRVQVGVTAGQVARLM